MERPGVLFDYLSNSTDLDPNEDNYILILSDS